MDEEWVQTGVMDEELLGSERRDGWKIIREELRDGCQNRSEGCGGSSLFKIGGWNSLQSINQNLSEEFIDENAPWLLIGIPSRNPFFVTQYLERHSVSSDRHMKKLMLLREGLHVMMQCYMRQQFADRCWLT